MMDEKKEARINESGLKQDFEIIILSDIEETDKFPKTRTINTGKVPPAKKRNSEISRKSSRKRIDISSS